MAVQASLTDAVLCPAARSGDMACSGKRDGLMQMPLLTRGHGKRNAFLPGHLAFQQTHAKVNGSPVFSPRSSFHIELSYSYLSS